MDLHSNEEILMKALSDQELKCISGAVSRTDVQEEKNPQAVNQAIDADYAWLGLASIVSLLFVGWTFKFK